MIINTLIRGLRQYFHPVTFKLLFILPSPLLQHAVLSWRQSRAHRLSLESLNLPQTVLALLAFL
jgi:hypothetical protein